MKELKTMNFPNDSETYEIVDAKAREDIEYLKNNTNIEESDPTVPEWAKQSNKPNYTFDELNGMLSIEKGGTGATDAATALANLGAASSADLGTLQTIVSGLSGGAKIATGSITGSSSEITVDIGFRPKFVLIGSPDRMLFIFDGCYYRLYEQSSALRWAYDSLTNSVTSTGFTCKLTKGDNGHYIAIG